MEFTSRDHKYQRNAPDRPDSPPIYTSPSGSLRTSKLAIESRKNYLRYEDIQLSPRIVAKIKTYETMYAKLQQTIRTLRQKNEQLEEEAKGLRQDRQKYKNYQQELLLKVEKMSRMVDEQKFESQNTRFQFEKVLYLNKQRYDEQLRRFNHTLNNQAAELCRLQTENMTFSSENYRIQIQLNQQKMQIASQKATIDQYQRNLQQSQLKLQQLASELNQNHHEHSQLLKRYLAMIDFMKVKLQQAAILQQALQQTQLNLAKKVQILSNHFESQQICDENLIDKQKKDTSREI